MAIIDRDLVVAVVLVEGGRILALPELLLAVALLVVGVAEALLRHLRRGPRLGAGHGGAYCFISDADFTSSDSYNTTGR